jgi:hypothetical protein
VDSNLGYSRTSVSNGALRSGAAPPPIIPPPASVAPDYSASSPGRPYCSAFGHPQPLRLHCPQPLHLCCPRRDTDLELDCHGRGGTRGGGGARTACFIVSVTLKLLDIWGTKEGRWRIGLVYRPSVGGSFKMFLNYSNPFFDLGDLLDRLLESAWGHSKFTLNLSNCF